MKLSATDSPLYFHKLVETRDVAGVDARSRVINSYANRKDVYRISVLHQQLGFIEVDLSRRLASSWINNILTQYPELRSEIKP